MTCPSCSTEFEPRTAWQRYCSGPCRQHSYNERRRGGMDIRGDEFQEMHQGTTAHYWLGSVWRPVPPQSSAADDLLWCSEPMPTRSAALHAAAQERSRLVAAQRASDTVSPR